MALTLQRTIQLVIEGDGTSTTFSVDLNVAPVFFVDGGGNSIPVQPHYTFNGYKPKTVVSVTGPSFPPTGTITGTVMTLTYPGALPASPTIHIIVLGY